MGSDYPDSNVENLKNADELIKLLNIRAGEFSQKVESIDAYFKNPKNVPDNVYIYAKKDELKKLKKNSEDILTEYNKFIDVITKYKDKINISKAKDKTKKISKFAVEENIKEMKEVVDDYVKDCESSYK